MSLVETETIFGRIVTGYDVEQWVLALLRKWSNTYLAELERQHGILEGELQRVRAWVLGPSFDKWPEDQIPAVLVTCPGIAPPPLKDGGGTYRAFWNVQIGCCCSARTQAESHALAQLFIAAHKAIIAQRPSLEGWASHSSWIDESYDPLSYDDTRSLYAGYATFAIEVDDVLTTLAGPITPDVPLSPDETDPWPVHVLVRTHDETVENYPTDQPLPTPQEDGS